MRERKELAGLLDYDDLIGRTSAPAGRSRRRLGAVQAGWRPRPSAAGRGAGHRAGAMAHRPCADRGVLRRRRRARGRTARCSRSATASSRSTPSRAPTPTSSIAARDTLRGGCGRAGRIWREVPLDVSFRSTAPVLALVDAVFADPIAAAGVAEPGAAAPSRRPRRPCRRGGAVAARAACRTRPSRSPGRCRSGTTAGDRAAAAGGDAGGVDRARRPAARCMLESQGRGAARRATCWCWCGVATTSPARWCAR